MLGRSAIYRAGSQSEAPRAFRDWKQRWADRRPAAVACVERDLEALLNFYAVPTAHWIKVRTTNVIERAFREVRRRTRPMSSFVNRESCDRIVFGVISHLDAPGKENPFLNLHKHLDGTRKLKSLRKESDKAKIILLSFFHLVRDLIQLCAPGKERVFLGRKRCDR